MEAVLSDFRTAPIDEKLRATLALLEKMTLSPGDLSTADVDAVRAAGVSDEAIEDAMYVCFLFNIYNRVSDTLRFHVPEGEDLWKAAARVLLLIGYR
jgi:alkylhydroperoxidase family enzyme